jgi:hypothetical protein
LKHTSVDSALFVIFKKINVINNPNCLSCYWRGWQAATSGSFAKLGASLRAHPENLLETLDNIEDIVFYQRKAFPYVISQSFFHSCIDCCHKSTTVYTARNLP